MDLKKELKDRLGVPENWDKYDYQTQRYSFDDMQEVLEDIVKKLTIPVVVQQSEQLCNNPHCQDGTVEVIYGEPLRCSNCDK